MTAIEQKHQQILHRVSQIRYAREGRAPTMEYVDQLQKLIDEELRMVESDELVRSNIQKVGVAIDDIRISPVNCQA